MRSSGRLRTAFEGRIAPLSDALHGRKGHTPSPFVFSAAERRASRVRPVAAVAVLDRRFGPPMPPRGYQPFAELANVSWNGQSDLLSARNVRCCGHCIDSTDGWCAGGGIGRAYMLAGRRAPLCAPATRASRRAVFDLPGVIQHVPGGGRAMAGLRPNASSAGVHCALVSPDLDLANDRNGQDGRHDVNGANENRGRPALPPSCRRR